MPGLYEHRNARTVEQAKAMRQLDDNDICMLCRPHLTELAKTLHRTRHWTIVENAFPYPGTKLHLLLVPDEHWADLLNLPDRALDDFWWALRWVRGRYQLDHYALGVRCGDCRYTGATIAHVHAHVIVADPVGPPVRFRMSGRSVG